MREKLYTCVIIAVGALALTPYPILQASEEFLKPPDPSASGALGAQFPGSSGTPMPPSEWSTTTATTDWQWPAFLSVTFGSGISINTQTGEVTIPEGMKMSDASKEFWKTIQAMFPEVCKK